MKKVFIYSSTTQFLGGRGGDLSRKFLSCGLCPDTSHLGVKMKRNFDYKMGQILARIVSQMGLMCIAFEGGLNDTLDLEASSGRTSVSFEF